MSQWVNHSPTAFRGTNGTADGAYSKGAWRLRVQADTLPWDVWLVSSHERHHAELTERSAWGSVLWILGAHHEHTRDETVLRRLADWYDACRTTQELWATYGSLVEAEDEPRLWPARLGSSPAYQRYLRQSLTVMPQFPANTIRRQAAHNALVRVAMQPADLLDLTESAPPWPLRLLPRRCHPDMRLRTLLKICAGRWPELSKRVGPLGDATDEQDDGSRAARSALIDSGFADNYCERWYSLYTNLLEEHGERTLGPDEQCTFSHELIVAIRPMGLPADVQSVIEVGEPPEFADRLMLANQERIELRAGPVRALWRQEPQNRMTQLLRDIPPTEHIVVTVRPLEDWLDDYCWDRASKTDLRWGKSARAAICLPVTVPAANGDPAEECDVVALEISSPQMLRRLMHAVGSDRMTLNVSARFSLEGREPSEWLALSDTVATYRVIDVEISRVFVGWLSQPTLQIRAGLLDGNYKAFALVVARHSTAPSVAWIGVCSPMVAQMVTAIVEGLGIQGKDDDFSLDHAAADSVVNIFMTRPWTGFAPIRRTALP